MSLAQPKVPGLLYYSLLALSIAIFIGFSYLSFLAYTLTKNTSYFLLSYIIIAPVFVSAFLFIVLLAIGKTGFYRELEQLKIYKIRT